MVQAVSPVLQRRDSTSSALAGEGNKKARPTRTAPTMEIKFPCFIFPVSNYSYSLFLFSYRLRLLLFFGTAEAVTNLFNGLSQTSSELGDLPRPKEQE